MICLRRRAWANSPSLSTERPRTCCDRPLLSRDMMPPHLRNQATLSGDKVTSVGRNLRARLSTDLVSSVLVLVM